MSGIARLLTQTATVKTYLGVKNNKPSYADPATDAVMMQERHELSRAADGAEITSTRTVLYAAITSLPLYVPNSLVTVNGRTATVTAVRRRDQAGPARIHHVEVELT